MATSSEIKQRAKALAEKTDVNSITPREVGGIMYDLASHSENVLRNGGTLGIRKVYESVAAMEADSTNPKDLWGEPLKKGNLVVIYDGTSTSVDNNKIYAFLKPGWKIATHLDAGYATKASLDAAIENILLQFRDSENALNESIGNLEETVTGNKQEVDAKLSELGKKVGDYELSSEFIRIVLDSDGKIVFGIQKDGNIYFAAGVPRSIQNYVENRIRKIPVKDVESVIAFVDDLYYEGTLREILNKKVDGYYEDNGEFVKVFTDNEGKIISYTRVDGSTYFYELRSESINRKQDKEVGKGLIDKEVSEMISSDNSEEEWTEIVKDKDGFIVSYRDKNGVRVENVGLDVQSLRVKNQQHLKESLGLQRKKQNLPKYGKVNIKSEKFYLTYDARYVDKNGIVLIQTEDDSIVNATNKVTLSYFYIKSTVTPINGEYNKQSVENNSVRLTFYAASEVSQVDGKYYVTESLNDGAVSNGSIRVTEIVDIPPYKAWNVDKSTEHFCIVDVDFGDFLKGNDFAVGVKYQGSSTLAYRKRNWRFTFYTDANYTKKSKIKIGEMVRVSGFNLKASYTDTTRVKEYYMNLIFMSMWDSRQIPFRYPWDMTHSPYTGANGMIKGFPCRVDVGGVFYGVHIFGLKKDKANYCISSDSDGLLVGGTRGNYQDRTNWTEASWEDWEDEVNDEMSESNKEALTSFFSFINSEEFTKENMPQRMSIVDWIDYFIGMQVFLMKDNTCRNMMLYSDKGKQKFYPFFYDLDLSWNYDFTNVSQDILVPSSADGKEGVSFAGDMSLWINFKNAYWDEICNRYSELRCSLFTKANFKELLERVVESIPLKDMELEKTKWGEGDTKGMNRLLVLLEKRLEWLDVYFKMQ